MTRIKNKIDKFKGQADWDNWIGKEIIKHSGKPFKSGLIVGVPTGTTTNLFSGKKAFIMDDSSIVDCYQCKLNKI